MQIIVLIQIVILIYSAIIHEYMHGWIAGRLGDDTAKNSGRLTMNPVPHIDPVGTLLVPFVLFLTNASFFIGWAKPVPYNPYNLRDKVYGGAKVALAGPMSNFVTALFFGFVSKMIPLTAGLKLSLIKAYFERDSAFIMSEIHASFLVSIYVISIMVVFINILLMVFNLVPIPPMDGSKVVMPFLPYNLQVKYAGLERYGMFLVLFFVMFGIQFIYPIVIALFSLIVGV